MMRKILFYCSIFLMITGSIYAKVGISFGGGGGYPLSSFGDNTLLRVNDSSGVMVDYKNGIGFFGGFDLLLGGLEIGYRFNSFPFSDVKRAPSGKIITLPNTTPPEESLIDTVLKTEREKVDGERLTLHTIDAGFRFYIIELLINPYLDAGGGLSIISALDEKSYGAHLYAGGGLDFSIAPFVLMGVQARYNIAIMQKKTALVEGAAKIAEGASFEVKDFASYMNYISASLMFTFAF